MIVEPLPDKKKYRLVVSIEFEINGKELEVPRDFIFDGASIPRLFWSAVTSPFDPQVMRAACIHDFLYRTHDVSKSDADKYFKKILIEDGVSNETAETMYAAVKLAGGHAYENGPKKLKEV